MRNYPFKERRAFNPNNIRFAFVGGVRYNSLLSLAKHICRNFPNHEFHFYGYVSQTINESELPKDVVSVGSKVKVKDYDFDEIVEYSIVGSAEADPMNFKLSNESPVGKGLVGKKVGDIVEVVVPDGVSKFEILEIKRD